MSCLLLKNVFYRIGVKTTELWCKVMKDMINRREYILFHVKSALYKSSLFTFSIKVTWKPVLYSAPLWKNHSSYRSIRNLCVKVNTQKACTIFRNQIINFQIIYPEYRKYILQDIRYKVIDKPIHEV